MRLFGIFALCFFVIFQIYEKFSFNVSEVKNSSDLFHVSEQNSDNGAKFAVVNLKKIAQESEAGKSIEEQISEINNKEKKDLLEFEDNIKQMDSDAKTSADERKVEDLQVILYDMTRTKRFQIQEAYKEAVKILEKEIHGTIKEIASKKGYSLVIIDDVVVCSDNSKCPNITQEAIDHLNLRVQRIRVDITRVKEREEGVK